MATRPAWAASAPRERTLADHAYEAIHQAIVTGALGPGERLRIEELAANLDLSFSPLREALQRLEAVGLVQIIPHRGARVTELSLDDLRDIWEARLALETTAIRRSAAHFSPASATLARGHLSELREADRRKDFAQAWKAHTDFHFSIYGVSGSPWLLRLITPLWESSQRYRLRWVPLQADLPTRDAEHEAILQACEAQRPQRAEVRLHNHVARTANQIANQMGSADLFALRRESRA